MMASMFARGHTALQLSNRLVLAVLFLLLSSTAHAVATLSGTVVDAADGTTPVHPAYIALIDPVTGEFTPGLETFNQPDGSYEISGIPPGEWKVLFESEETANAYRDELYDGIECNNARCDRVALGDVFVINEGNNILDVDLELGGVLTGTVVDAADGTTPVHPVYISLIDPVTGAFVARLDTFNRPDGSYEIGGIPPGEWKVLFESEESANAYQDELYDGVKCDNGNCDRVALGEIFVINEGNNALDVDLGIEPPISNGGLCGSRDLITRAGFEDSPGYQIVFTSPSSALFTKIGESQTFSIEYLDADGLPVDPSGLEWCLEDDSLLQLSLDGMSATVEATDFDVTSVDLVVRDATSGAEARALIMLASLHDNAVVVDDELYISGIFPATGETTIIQLSRTAFTESLVAGMVIGTNGGDGLLVRILSVTLHTDHVELEVEAAGLSDLFAELSIDTVSAPINIQGEQEPGGAASMVAKTPFGRVEVAGQDLLQALPCSGGVLYTDAPARFKFDANPRLHFILDLSLQSIVNGKPDRFELGSYGDFTATLSFDYVDISVAPNISCQWKSTPIPLPVHPPIFGISIGMAAVPIWGFTAGVQSSLLPSARFSVPPVSFRSDYAGWIGMVPDKDFPTLYNEVYYNGNSYGRFIWGEAETPPPPEDRAAFELGAFGYIGLNVEPSIIVGGAAFGFRLYDIRFGARYDLTIDEPFDPLHKDYMGPSWNLRLGGESRWNPSAGSHLQKVMDVIFPSWTFGSFDFSQPLWEDFVPFASSPSVFLNTECTPTNCKIDPQRQFDELSYEVTPSGVPGPKWPFVSKADLVGFKDGAETAVILDADHPLAGEKVSGWWKPEESQMGSWEVRGLMKDIDHVSLWKPYPTTKATADVARTQRLLIDKRGTGGESLTAGQGKVVSADNEIDCGEKCSTFIVANTPYQIEAQNSGGWKFVKWADNSDVCPGSSNSVCEATMSIDKIAKAVFEESLNYTFFFAVGRDAPDTTYTVMEEYAPGDEVTVYNGQVYHMGLKLDGQPVKVLNFDAECCEISTNLHQFPTLDFGMTDHVLPGYEFTVRDLTNDRDVTFNIELTVSNEGYRNTQGRSLDIKNYSLNLLVNVTYEPFPEGQQSGTLRQVFPDESVQIGTWGMQGGNSFAWKRVNCDAGEQIIPAWGRIVHNGWAGLANSIVIGPGHAWATETWHFCPEVAQFRLVFGDH
jgi:hypothetical protein